MFSECETTIRTDFIFKLGSVNSIQKDFDKLWAPAKGKELIYQRSTSIVHHRCHYDVRIQC